MSQLNTQAQKYIRRNPHLHCTSVTTKIHMFVSIPVKNSTEFLVTQGAH